MNLFGLGQPESEILIAALTVVVAYVIAVLINYFFRKVVKRLAAKTRTAADDIFVHKIQRPIVIIAVLVGLNHGLKYITDLGPYFGLIDLVLALAYIIIGAKVAIEIFELLFAVYLEKIAPKTKTEMDTQLMPIIRNITKAVIYILAILLIAGKLGFDIGPALAGLGIGGIAIALALQDTLSGFFAGFYIIADKPVKKGDYVRLESGEEGYIQSIGWRSTKIKALQNYIIVIPNKKLAGSILYNYDKPQKEMSLVLTIGVDYGSDVDKVEKMLIEEATKFQKKDDRMIGTWTPIVRFSNFSDYSLDYTVILRIKGYTEKWGVEGNFKKAVFKRFKKEKISIPFPTKTVYLEK